MTTALQAGPAGSASETLRAVAERFWDAFLAANPVYATILGDRRFDDRLEDRSPAARSGWAATLEDVRRIADALDPADLSARERVTRSMLIEETSGQLAVLESGVDEWSINPIDGPQTQVVELVDYQPIATEEDAGRYVARVGSYGTLIDQVVDGLRRALAQGRVASRVPVERVIDELDVLLATPSPSWRVAEAADRTTWNADAAAAFRQEIERVVASTVIRAFERYRACLVDEILPVARPSERPGLVHVPDGLAAYRANARAHSTLDLDPMRVHEIGLAEIERIDAAFVDLGARVLGVHGLEATLQRLRDDPSLRFRSADELLAAAQGSLDRAQAATWRWFGRLPRAVCEVVAIPEASAPHQTLAYYAWPALDGSRPGRFHVNLHAPETRARFEAEALAFHESVPGHHLQLAVAQELEGLPAFQRTLGSNAFSEGWALYCERLADEMGLYSSDLDRFGILSFDAWRASRLVVDSGMHALGWSRDEAIAFMRAHTALDDGNIANEVDRYIAWPGQAISYKLGQLEISRLRAEATARLGAAFDIRAFHDTVLGSGAVGLLTLGGIVDAWVAGHET